MKRQKPERFFGWAVRPPYVVMVHYAQGALRRSDLQTLNRFTSRMGEYADRVGGNVLPPERCGDGSTIYMIDCPDEASAMQMLRYLMLFVNTYVAKRLCLDTSQAWPKARWVGRRHADEETGIWNDPYEEDEED